MSSKPRIDDTLRERIISEPDVILDDTEMMRALIAANEREIGAVGGAGGGPRRDAPTRQVTLRQLDEGDSRVYGRTAQHIRSEACLLLDFGADRLPGMLVMGAEDPHQFSPQQGSDLLAFFAGVFERVMRRWLS